MKICFRFMTILFLAASAYSAAFGITPAEIFNKTNPCVYGTLNDPSITDSVKIETTEGSNSTGQSEIVYYTKGNKTRQETTTTSGSLKHSGIMIFDGEDNWVIMDDKKMRMGGKSAKSTETAKEAQERLDKYYNDNNMIIRNEQLNGKNCYVVGPVVKSSGTVTLRSLRWVDAENIIPYQVIAYDASGKETSKSIMSDYRTVLNNIQMPFLTEFYMGGKFQVRRVIKSIKVNQGLSDDLFDTSKYKEIDVTQMMKVKNTENQAVTGSNSSTEIDSGTIKNKQPAAH